MIFTFNQTFQKAHHIFLLRHSNLIKLENAQHTKFFFNYFRGKGWLVTTVNPPPESTTECLRIGTSEIIGESGCDGLFFYGLVIQSFPESLKDDCNEKLLKICVNGTFKTKKQAEKEGT